MFGRSLIQTLMPLGSGVYVPSLRWRRRAGVKHGAPKGRWAFDPAPKRKSARGARAIYDGWNGGNVPLGSQLIRPLTRCIVNELRLHAWRS